MVKVTTVRLPDSDADELGAIAKVEGNSMAEQIRKAIREHIEAKRQDKAFQQRLRESIERHAAILKRLAG